MVASHQECNYYKRELLHMEAYLMACLRLRTGSIKDMFLLSLEMLPHLTVMLFIIYFLVNADELGEIFADAEKPLYPGCTNFTKLSSILKLHKLPNLWGIKVENGALRLFDMRINKSTRKSPCGSVIKSPRQPDCEQCEFFVLFYMKQIMETDHGQLQMRSLQSLFTKMTYSVEEINEMRVEWAECIQEGLYA